MTISSSRIPVCFIHQPLNVMFAVTNYSSRSSQSSTNEFVVDYENPEINTPDKSLHNNAPAIILCRFQSPDRLIAILNICCVSFSMIPVNGFYHERKSIFLNGIIKSLLRPDNSSAWYRDFSSFQ